MIGKLVTQTFQNQVEALQMGALQDGLLMFQSLPLFTQVPSKMDCQCCGHEKQWLRRSVLSAVYVSRFQCGHSTPEIQIIYYNYSDILEQESTFEKKKKENLSDIQLTWAVGGNTLDLCAAPACCTA